MTLGRREEAYRRQLLRSCFSQFVGFVITLLENMSLYLGSICAGPGSRGPGTNTNLVFCTKFGNSFSMSANDRKFSEEQIRKLLENNLSMQENKEKKDNASFSQIGKKPKWTHGSKLFSYPASFNLRQNYTCLRYHYVSDFLNSYMQVIHFCFGRSFT